MDRGGGQGDNSGAGEGGRDAVEEKGPQRWPSRPLERRLKEVAKAVGDGYCRLQMPLRLALNITETVAGHRLGALEGGGDYLPSSNASLGGGEEGAGDVGGDNGQCERMATRRSTGLKQMHNTAWIRQSALLDMDGSPPNEHKCEACRPWRVSGRRMLQPRGQGQWS